ncbi:tRNA (adenosine(37)-N6)-threonylcarbamoyltransferase complex ATPase subunit type 1 TsaE [Campylobacter sp. VicNov18]|uniref:tRNA (adenosine(37)-N6)-threonylcarbamoyltransferase complex ATPase subunit type 1 TsaE n=1 Tax=Campylobacter bilis TaxID=2691918 RepID=UPI00130E9E2F|nr:tRNA (adenosine(37)-N6)-threonylcarbamoyltransferase complex ATPase subunit type 1 TsaE [Campylobacter bilis]MPV63459.1 tRNA (adenosine(37)-N6)-threonylcarbamoyltransferase complex ATPase subunit type 1 TsaE [Campylobacter hepaticus]MBM0636958.1 tRNA (adenosine(37)-N6)-threonylcarbamoyltransferase complex ATPase subunit type 1 TsaE [Campylobacter bilis]MCC8277670.1 tRNA (adenosine(37)-N6)-threonylcarbamoyltransferase complex ATPase subunit type 1 TsaE [Campylobacter bilis]MCC8299279.1 tRNA (
MKEFILAKEELSIMLKHLPKSGVVLLEGDLASGKTSLVQAWVKFLGLNDKADSPTFSIMQKYHDQNICIYHYDIYQQGLEGLLINGLFENFFEEGLHLVEWGDENLKKALLKLGILSMQIKISLKENKRKYQIYE